MDEGKEKIKVKGVEKKKKNEAGKKSAGGGKNDDGVGGGGGGIATILLKLDLHCEGCAKKVRRCVRHFEGVEDVKADASTGILTVKGNVDPLWLREKVESKTKKKVALLSAQPKKVAAGTGGAGGERNSDEKVENKAAEEKEKNDEKVENKVAEEKKGEDKKPQKVQCNTEVVQLHCDGSAKKVKRFIVKQLAPYLKHKLKRNVVVAAPKKCHGSGGRSDNHKKKEVARAGGGGDDNGDRKKKDGVTSTVAKAKAKAEVMNTTMEYNSGGGYNNPHMYYTMPPPMYNQDYGVTMQDHHGYYGHHSIGHMQPPPYLATPRDYGYGYGFNTGYVSPRHYTTPRDHGYGHDHGHDHGHGGYVPQPYIAPQYFSDENPNACSVM